MYQCGHCHKVLDGRDEASIVSCKGCNDEFCSETCLEMHLNQREDCREEY